MKWAPKGPVNGLSPAQRDVQTHLSTQILRSAMATERRCLSAGLRIPDFTHDLLALWRETPRRPNPHLTIDG